jgi:hypothetical protein
MRRHNSSSSCKQQDGVLILARYEQQLHRSSMQLHCSRGSCFFNTQTPQQQQQQQKSSASAALEASYGAGSDVKCLQPDEPAAAAAGVTTAAEATISAEVGTAKLTTSAEVATGQASQGDCPGDRNSLTDLDLHVHGSNFVSALFLQCGIWRTASQGACCSSWPTD